MYGVAVLIVIFVLVVYYFGHWCYRELFEDAFTDKPKTRRFGFDDDSAEPKPDPLKQEELDKIIYETELKQPAYSTDPINSVDDYEYNLVFRNEGDNKALTKAQRDMLMSQYPMDWSIQPPSSDKFQEGREKFKEAFENKMAASQDQMKQGNPYKGIDGSTLTPPDSLAEERKEREILATYVPKKPQELTTYDVEDAKDLIEKIYDAKGLVPDYKQTGKNQFTIYSTSKKDAPIVWEDEVKPAAQSTQGANPDAGENTIIAPSVANITSVGLDPFFTPGEKTRDGKWDYTRWTPGLERMFAPTSPQTNWF